ncbi:TIGR00266 family protein [Antrihabitans stalactiti]|uniref:TIGR00266 family protein n=1 Tax=Antrihabitans stalactiti TaxID=2584121 RepID=A0A848KJH3_9NOCA|nr:TIGR00266 family protein [Antrihabitans stalactiti]NMN98271.1 TIGR00266 family protein [Antrihabitans stalactiti]
MQTEISCGPAFAFAEIAVPPGGSVRVEAGAMAMMRGDVSTTTSTSGGFLKGLRRSLGGASFFVNDFTSQRGGLVGVAGTLPGDLVQTSVAGGTALLVQSGCWLASDPTVDVDSKWGGSKGLFSGAGLVLLRCSGNGDILLSSYGAIRSFTLAPGEPITLESGHVVAFDESVQYRIRKAGGWKSTILGGGGIVTEFTGPGRVWMQTRSATDLVDWLRSRLPSNSGNNEASS